MFFASEIKQLLPLVSKRRVNTPVMSAYLWQGLLDHSEETFFEGIEKIPAKTNVVISLQSGESTRKKYWDYRASPNGDGGHTVERFRDLFIDSVRIRLRSDVRMGVLLSGGLDSSTIAVAANNLLQSPLESFSVISGNPKYSEEQFIDALCASTEIPNQKLMFRDTNALASVARNALSTTADSAWWPNSRSPDDQRTHGRHRAAQRARRLLSVFESSFSFYARCSSPENPACGAASRVAAKPPHAPPTRQFHLSEARRYIFFLQKRGNGDYRRLEPLLLPLWESEDMREPQIEADNSNLPCRR